MKNYCCNCDAENEFTIKEILAEYKIEGIKFNCLQNIAYCETCGEEVYIAELSDGNVQVAHAKYKKLKGLALEEVKK